MGFNPLRWVANVVTWGTTNAVNVLTGGASDETFSSRMGRYRVDKSRWKRAVGKPLAAGIDLFLGKGHCARAAEYERTHLHREESLDDRPGD